MFVYKKYFGTKDIVELRETKDCFHIFINGKFVDEIIIGKSCYSEFLFRALACFYYEDYVGDKEFDEFEFD